MLKDRITQALTSGQGLTKSGLANACGIQPPSVSAWFSGRTKEIKGDNLLRAAEYLNVRPRWLANGKGPMRPAQQAPDASEWTDISGFAQAVGLGDGVEAEEYQQTHKLKFRSSSLQRKRLNPQSLSVVYGRGESMLPRIRAGDAILFDTSDTTPRDECLYVVYTMGAKGLEYSAKRCREIGGLWVFDALNPEGDHAWRKPRLMDDPKRPIVIVGRIRWIGSWED